ncbi:uncharacterized protein LOC134077725 [Sardina pilchardus]|uniref:uncharacterized protein LOC134077725 n=1 Tax=Sardina pilchardus TaxID=27697 RepID=UPI002E163C00
MAQQLLPVPPLKKMGSPATAVLALIVLFLFLELLFKFVFLCPCDPNYGRHVCFCIMYMLLPACIFFYVCLLMDNKRMETCGWTREDFPRPSTKCCTVFLKALSIGLLWLIIAFINGDWYVCLMTHSNGTAEEQLACKDEGDMTKSEKVEVTYYTNVSRSVGLGLILIVLLLWVGGSCRRTSYRQHLFDQQLEEESEDIFLQMIVDEAKQKSREGATNIR